MTKLIATLALLALCCATISEARVVCYFVSWAIYRLGDGKFEAANVDPNLCSHIIYVYVRLNEKDGSVEVFEDWDPTGLSEINHLMGLKQQNPNLKVIVSMGGWSEGSTKFSYVAAHPALRQNMVNSVMSFVNDHGFDGFDLDWEYPRQRGGKTVDSKNFVILLGELKSALNAQGKILTAAVNSDIPAAQSSYPNISAISNNLDMINIMTYDIFGTIDRVLHHLAPLFASHLDKGHVKKNGNVAAVVKFWVDSGADPSKINMGVGTDGRSYTLADPSKAELYDRIIGEGKVGEDGILGYNEICLKLNNWTYVWDDEQKVPHRVQGNQWVTYNDARSLEAKVDYGKSLNIGGYSVWSLDTDDFRGLCGEGPYPLLKAINNRL